MSIAIVVAVATFILALLVHALKLAHTDGVRKTQIDVLNARLKEDREKHELEVDKLRYRFGAELEKAQKELAARIEQVHEDATSRFLTVDGQRDKRMDRLETRLDKLEQDLRGIVERAMARMEALCSDISDKIARVSG